MFDESTSWYTVDSTPSDPIETEFEIDTEEDDRLRLTLGESPILTRLSGPQEPPSTSRTSPKTDKGNAKMPEYNDLDVNESAHSLESEYGDWMYLS